MIKLYRFDQNGNLESPKVRKNTIEQTSVTGLYRSGYFGSYNTVYGYLKKREAIAEEIECLKNKIKAAKKRLKELQK